MSIELNASGVHASIEVARAKIAVATKTLCERILLNPKFGEIFEYLILDGRCPSNASGMCIIYSVNYEYRLSKSFNECPITVT